MVYLPQCSEAADAAGNAAAQLVIAQVKRPGRSREIQPEHMTASTVSSSGTDIAKRSRLPTQPLEVKHQHYRSAQATPAVSRQSTADTVSEVNAVIAHSTGNELCLLTTVQ